MIKVRNAQYQLSQLEKGDRFYFAGDRKKVIYEVHSFFDKLQKGYWKYYCNCLNQITMAKEPEVHFRDRRVIFLRNANDKTIQ